MIWEVVAKPAMIKADLIEELSRVVEIPQPEAEIVVETMLQSMVRALRAGDKVQIRGFETTAMPFVSWNLVLRPVLESGTKVPASKPTSRPSKVTSDPLAVPASPLYNQVSRHTLLPGRPAKVSTADQKRQILKVMKRAQRNSSFS